MQAAAVNLLADLRDEFSLAYLFISHDLAIAARYADTIVAHPKGIDGMKDYRNDVRAQMRLFGRDPDSCKVLFMVLPDPGRHDGAGAGKGRAAGGGRGRQHRPSPGADGLDHQHRLFQP